MDATCVLGLLPVLHAEVAAAAAHCRPGSSAFCAKMHGYRGHRGLLVITVFGTDCTYVCLLCAREGCAHALLIHLLWLAVPGTHIVAELTRHITSGAVAVWRL